MSPGTEIELMSFCTALLPETLRYTELLGRLGGLASRGFSYLGVGVIFDGNSKKHVLSSWPGIQRGESCQAEKCLDVP